jgi:hypothetical protein
MKSKAALGTLNANSQSTLLRHGFGRAAFGLDGADAGASAVLTSTGIPAGDATARTNVELMP